MGNSTSNQSLPDTVFSEILIKLPIKGIVMCKSVCKEWYRQISDPQFAKFHSTQAQTYPLIRASSNKNVSRVLYVVEFPEMGRSCVHDWEMRCLNAKDGHYKTVKLESELKIPVRNAEVVPDNGIGVQYGVHVKKRRCTKVKPYKHKYRLVNSCNGFICLADMRFNNPLVVCNPVTGEFIDLPEAKNKDMGKTIRFYSGFGFDETMEDYKVIRIRIRKFGSRNARQIRSVLSDKMIFSANVAELLTLGSGSWKNIGYAPFSCQPFTSDTMSCPTYLNGTLHWLLSRFNNLYLPCFDFKAETFRSIPLPQGLQRRTLYQVRADISLGVLAGCLCVCDSSNKKSLHIWVMKEGGDVESWTQDFSISLDISSYGPPQPPRFPGGLYQPLNLLTNGAILLFLEHHSALICYHPEKQWLTKYMKIQGINSKFEAIAHIPSFTSLKQALKGNEVQVHNIGSRCGKYKFFGETKVPFLVEDERYSTLQDPPRNSQTGDHRME